MSEEIDKSKVVGKRIVSVESDEGAATLTLDDGSELYITSDGGCGYNEGLSWLRFEIYEADPKPAPESVSDQIKRGVIPRRPDGSVCYQ